MDAHNGLSIYPLASSSRGYGSRSMRGPLRVDLRWSRYAIAVTRPVRMRRPSTTAGSGSGAAGRAVSRGSPAYSNSSHSGLHRRTTDISLTQAFLVRTIWRNWIGGLHGRMHRVLFLAGSLGWIATFSKQAKPGTKCSRLNTLKRVRSDSRKTVAQSLGTTAAAALLAKLVLSCRELGRSDDLTAAPRRAPRCVAPAKVRPRSRVA